MNDGWKKSDIHYKNFDCIMHKRLNLHFPNVIKWFHLIKLNEN